MFVDLFFDKGLQLRSKLSRGACPQHSRPQVLDILKSELFKLSHLSSNMVFSFECVCVGGGGGGGVGGRGRVRSGHIIITDSRMALSLDLEMTKVVEEK